MIVPSIDLMNGNAVQLKQGRKKMLEIGDVLGLALKFRKYGEITVIDLDAAFDKGNNLELIKKICKIAQCRVGGGIRTIEKANEILQAGAKKIIIGTNATPEFLKKFPKDRLIVAIDTKNGFVMNRGWTSKTNWKPEDVIKKLEPYCNGFLFTNIEKEGLMKGIDLNMIKKIGKLTKKKLTAAGGISTIKEIGLLEGLGIDSQLGMALYKGKINLPEAFASLLDFKKNDGLVPTITQDCKNQVLMLAYSSKKSVLETLRTGKATYYSRSGKKLWTKGETSGNYQYILNVKYDCDRDSLLFTVQQKNFACHSGRYSCFDDEKFGFEELFEIVKDRVKNPKNSSYTSKMASDENKIKAKIREECLEVVNYKDKGNLTWEVADLLYFTYILMAKKGISLADIKNELWRRRK